MALLVLDRAQLEVKSEGDTLALYEAGVRCGTVPLKLVERCIIQGGQTKLDSGVLMKLAEAGATTTIMSARLPRRVAIVLGPQHNDAAVRLAQAHRVIDKGACLLGKAGRAIFYADWERHSKVLRRWLQQHANQLARHLRGVGEAWLEHEEDDL